jgi:NADP-reducing hydrogenase subunit HndB
MPRLKSLEELRKLRDEVKRDMAVRDQAGTRIVIAMGTCGIAVGAREVMSALLRELESTRAEARVETVGCQGLCAHEPLVAVEPPGEPRVVYGKVQPEMVARLVREHVMEHQPVKEWALTERELRGRFGTGNGADEADQGEPSHE